MRRLRILALAALVGCGTGRADTSEPRSLPTQAEFEAQFGDRWCAEFPDCVGEPPEDCTPRTLSSTYCPTYVPEAAADCLEGAWTCEPIGTTSAAPLWLSTPDACDDVYVDCYTVDTSR